MNDDKSTDFSRKEREIEKEGSLAYYARFQGGGKTEHAVQGLDNVQKTPVLCVKHIRISSMLLASESQFFHKLFTNGMMESNQNIISLQVSEEEVEPVLEIINFIYNGEFSKLDPKDLLTTLLTADKYEVSRAIIECGELLFKSEMTLETALIL
ncbi:BTB/POZ domain-containing protein At4g01160-like [Triticum urartu]|nr:BTB/POZ domain-containing protein At4g01160-like [Triticum urartu]